MYSASLCRMKNRFDALEILNNSLVDFMLGIFEGKFKEELSIVTQSGLKRHNSTSQAVFHH